MKVFRLSTEFADHIHRSYYGTLSDVKRAAKALDKSDRKASLVEELDVQSDKAGVVAMLNIEPIITTSARAWNVTVRGALEEPGAK